ncbi:hypothetical protein DRE_03708 [Drechslerella stenobrocha 248]|uniref:Uncharacterized protein n=1 Tax=Drechslerella stenobrocha 248 TaxID=1043628 RepID=W7HS83_9PEZI|nr:hypothetical protein DRE_03708 [Drechslerella stenobrocha 248]
MSNPTTDVELYGRPKPKNSIPANLSSTSQLALSSELARLAASGKTHGRKRPSTSSKDDIFRKGSNKGVSSRAAKDLADGANTSTRKTTSKDIGYLDDAELQRARKKMEEKTRLYNAMKRGDYVPPAKKFKGGWAGAEEDRAGSLIDFDRKWAERQADKEEGSETSSDDELSARSDDEEMVEYEDEFGRTRNQTKREVRRVQREDARVQTMASAYDSDEDTRRRRVDPSRLIYGDVIQTAAFSQDELDRRKKEIEESRQEEQDSHYDATKEVRTKGVGFYQFSQDGEARKKEMEALAAEREKTAKGRQEKEARKEERRKEVERRREDLKKRRQGKEGERWLQNFLEETPAILSKAVEDKPSQVD